MNWDIPPRTTLGCMATDSPETTGAATGTSRVKRGMAEMLKGGVIMDVVTAEQAKIAEDAGAVAVMALERVPADIRAPGGGWEARRVGHGWVSKGKCRWLTDHSKKKKTK